MNSRLGTIVIAAALAVSTASCAANTDTAELEGGEKVITEGKLTVCTHLPYEPFQFKRGGEVVGFDVDLMDLVAEELGVEQTIVNTPFETIETGQAMSTGKCDIAAAGMTITEERARVMDFADPYFQATRPCSSRPGRLRLAGVAVRGDRRRAGQHHRQGVRRGERARRRGAEDLRGPRAPDQRGQDR
jgi:polar amino acid transport system substrate-binding protein